MSISDQQESVLLKRSVKRRRSELSPYGHFVTEEDEMNEDVFYNHNNNEYKQNDADVIAAEVQLFLEGGTGSEDNNDNELNIRNKQFKIERLIERLLAALKKQRIIDCIVFIVDKFEWYCSSCRQAGVMRCGIEHSPRMTTRAIINHISSAIHYKYSTPPIQQLLKEYEQQSMRLIST